jgi:serine/threonine-protein kinase
LSQILEREPDWSALPEASPPALLRLLHRCLEKEPRRRLRDAGDIALALEDLDLERQAIPEDSRQPQSSPFQRYAPWIAAVLAAVVAVIGWFGRSSEPAPENEAVLRFTQTSPGALDISRIGHAGSAVAISPDGHVLAWIASMDSETQLFIRHLDEEKATPIENSDGALAPFFSPDSQRVGFWAKDKLRKVSVRGGVQHVIADISHLHGASWLEGSIAMGNLGDGTMWLVADDGDTVKQIEPKTATTYTGGYPYLLPGSEALLATSELTGSLDVIFVDSGEVRTIAEQGTNAKYLDSGHLLWTQGDSLVMAPFDLPTYTVTGDIQTVQSGILSESSEGLTSHMSISDQGTLAFLPGTLTKGFLQPTWISLDGQREALQLPGDSSYLSPRVSPDGSKVLLSRQTTGRSIWIADLGRGIMDRTTPEESFQFWSIWTPDGSQMIFNTQMGGGTFNLWMQPTDFSAPAVRLTDGPGIQVPLDITRDGKTVVFQSPQGSTDVVFRLALLHMDGESITRSILETAGNAMLGNLSPDDRWIAYASDATGRLEVYAQPFPSPGPTVRISSNGGTEPIWAPSGERIYYRSPNGRRVFAVDVDVETDSSLTVGKEELLFEGPFPAGIQWGRKWDIDPDGDRFLMFEFESPDIPDGIRVVVNWDTELERLISEGN